MVGKIRWRGGWRQCELPPCGLVEQNGGPAEFGNGCARRVGSGSWSVTLWPLELP